MRVVANKLVAKVVAAYARTLTKTYISKEAIWWYKFNEIVGGQQA